MSSTQTALNLLDHQILDRAGKTVATEMAGEPRIAGSLEDTLGRTYLTLGLLPQAQAHLKSAVDIRTRAFGPDSLDTLRSMLYLGRVYGRQGQYPEAEKIFRESLEALRRTVGPENQDTLQAMNGLGIVYYSEQRYELAEKVQREAAEVKQRVLGPDHPDTHKSIANLALVLVELKRFPRPRSSYSTRWSSIGRPGRATRRVPSAM